MAQGKGIFVCALLAFSLLVPAAARSDDSEVADCPGYADHLRNARAYLERSDRASALDELKRAEEALHGCEAAQASETALAACVTSSPTG